MIAGLIATLLCTVLLAVGGVDNAGATPVVTLQARPLPIPGFAGSGDHLGAGTELSIQVHIQGHEYGGGLGPEVAAPLEAMTLGLPRGTSVDTRYLPSCPSSALEPGGSVRGCPEASRAGPNGSVVEDVAVDHHMALEEAAIEPFYTSYGLALLIRGLTPSPFDTTASGTIEPASQALASSTPTLSINFPFLETEPGAPVASIESISLGLGSGSRPAGAAPSYLLRLPSVCSRGLAFVAELSFAEPTGVPQRVTAAYAAPCPAGGAHAGPEETPVPNTEGVVTAPRSDRCISRRDFRIHIVRSGHLVYRLVTVELNRRSVKVLRGTRDSARIDLRGLPRGRYVARITVVTSTGRVISGTRTYHTCATRPLHPKRPPRL
jgi:hypothetical protein